VQIRTIQESSSSSSPSLLLILLLLILLFTQVMVAAAEVVIPITKLDNKIQLELLNPIKLQAIHSSFTK